MRPNIFHEVYTFCRLKKFFRIFFCILWVFRGVVEMEFNKPIYISIYSSMVEGYPNYTFTSNTNIHNNTRILISTIYGIIT